MHTQFDGMGIYGDGSIISSMVSTAFGAEEPETPENNPIHNHLQWNRLSRHGHPAGIRIFLLQPRNLPDAVQNHRKDRNHRLLLAGDDAV